MENLLGNLGNAFTNYKKDKLKDDWSWKQWDQYGTGTGMASQARCLGWLQRWRWIQASAPAGAGLPAQRSLLAQVWQLPAATWPPHPLSTVRSVAVKCCPIWRLPPFTHRDGVTFGSFRALSDAGSPFKLVMSSSTRATSVLSGLCGALAVPWSS